MDLVLTLLAMGILPIAIWIYSELQYRKLKGRTMNTAVLTPAYGRDYNSPEAALAAFHADKDFIICTITDRWVGRPCNKSDLIQYGKYTHVEIRFDGERELIVVPLTPQSEKGQTVS